MTDAAERAARDSTSNRAAETRRMDALARLAGGVAHDFNNLLTSMRGLAALALEEIEPDHPIRPDLEEILKSAQRATDLTRDLLAFSRRQRMEIESIDLNAVVSSIADDLRGKLPAGLVLHTVLGPPARVMADRALLQQAILNLVRSAQHALDNRGTIRLDTSAAGDPTAAGLEPGRFARLLVVDDAVIPAQQLDSVFDPFSPPRSAAKATALSLAVSYGIVTQVGGRITVDSDHDRGTTFSVYLPLDETARTGAAPSG